MVLTDNDPDDWKGLIELLDRDYGGIERKEGRVISSQDELSYRLGDKNYRLVQSVGKDELDPTPFSLYVRFMMPDK